ncbi:hypothetical protein ACQ4PT_066786 [Festuca glaucescens]
MAFVGRPCTVALLACAAAFLVAAVGAQPADPSGKPLDPNPFLTDPDVEPVYMSPGAPSQWLKLLTDRFDRVHVCCCQTVCDLTGTECYDPRFVGSDGNKFLFHGRRDADFCLLSDSNLHINAHFIGKRNVQAARDFTWVQALGIRFGGHRLYLGVKRTVTWNSAVDRLAIAFDGLPVELDAAPAASWSPASAPALSVFRTGAANGVVVRLDGRFRIVANAVPVTEEDSRVHGYGLTAGDSLAHLNVAFKFHSISADVHGVLGQTYRSDYVSAGVDMGAKIPVMGGAGKYQVSNIFGTDCEVARFAGEDLGEVGLIQEPADTMCGSGKGSAGLVCKK